MAHQLFALPKATQVTPSTVVQPGAKAYFYITGTTTPLDTYSDSGLTTPNANPVVADASGVFGAIYLDPTKTYKLTLKTSADVLIYTVDPVNDQILSQAIIGQYLYPRTAAEIAAGVTPTDYSPPPGDIRRYGAVADDTTDCTQAFQDAIDQANSSSGSEIFIPQGTWLVASALSGARGLKITGEGRYRSIVHYSGNGNLYTFTGSSGNPDSGAMVFRDFTVKGSSVAGNLIELTTAGQVEFTGMRFWLSGACFVKLDNDTHRVAFDNCLFQSWATAAIFTSNLCSIFTVTNCQFNILGGDSISQNASSACISLGVGEQLCIQSCNTNGDDTLSHFVRIRESLGRLFIGECYSERTSGSNIRTDTGAVISGAIIQNCQVSCADSMAIELSSGNPAHTGVIIRNIRRPESTAGTRIVNFGSGVVDFDYSGVPLDGSADHVQGYSGYRQVRKYFDGRIELHGSPSTAVTTLAAWTFAFPLILGSALRTTSTLTPSQITSDQNDYEPTNFLTSLVIRLSTDASRTITGMGRDGFAHIKYLVNVGSQNVVLAHQSASSTANKRFRLPGSSSYTIAPNEGVMAFYDTVQDCWRVLDK